jgi:hypothetical protein
MSAAITESGAGRVAPRSQAIQGLATTYAASLNCSVTDVSTTDHLWWNTFLTKYDIGGLLQIEIGLCIECLHAALSVRQSFGYDKVPTICGWQDHTCGSPFCRIQSPPDCRVK